MRKRQRRRKRTWIWIPLVIVLAFVSITVIRTSRVSIQQGEFIFQDLADSLLNRDSGTVNQYKISESDDWSLILINESNPVPSNYEVNLIELSNGRKVDERIYPELQRMFDDARSDGLNLFVREGYRRGTDQKKLYENRIEKYIS